MEKPLWGEEAVGPLQTAEGTDSTLSLKVSGSPLSVSLAGYLPFLCHALPLPLCSPTLSLSLLVTHTQSLILTLHPNAVTPHSLSPFLLPFQPIPACIQLLVLSGFATLDCHMLFPVHNQFLPATSYQEKLLHPTPVKLCQVANQQMNEPDNLHEKLHPSGSLSACQRATRRQGHGVYIPMVTSCDDRQQNASHACLDLA